MKKNNGLPAQAGFTLIELLIGVTIAVMIFMTASSVMALLFRSDLKTKRIEQIQQTKNDLQIEFTNSIKWASTISFTPDQMSTLTIDQNVYSVADGQLRRNNDPITPSSLTVKKFTVQDYSLDGAIKSLELVVDIENENNNSVKDSIRLVVSQRRTLFEEK